MERKRRRGGFYTDTDEGHPRVPDWVGKILAPIVGLGIIANIIKAVFFG